MRTTIQWSSHLPVLMHVMSITHGDVLEMGMGLFSTPFLHWACFEKRMLVSYESSLEYMRHLESFRSDTHIIEHVEDWDAINIRRPWDVAFIDHDPGERRKEDIKILAPYAKYVVVHDTEERTDSKHRFSEIYPLFTYRFDFKKNRVHTSVLSNFVDVRNLMI